MTRTPLYLYQALRTLLAGASEDTGISEDQRETLTSTFDTVTDIIQDIQEPGSSTTPPVAPKLAAAAPDLLEAVKLLQAALTQYRLRDVRKRYSLCVADAAATSAVFKAEGR